MIGNLKLDYDSKTFMGEIAPYRESEIESVFANLIHIGGVDDGNSLKKNAWRAYESQILASREPDNVRPIIGNATVTGCDNLKTTNAGHIFVAYHYGPYRIVPAAIAHAGLPVTIVIDKDVAAAQGSAFAEQIAGELGFNGWEDDRVSILDTRSPSFLVNVVRDLKRGRSVLFFIDANRGLVNTATRNQHELAAIDFCGHKLRSQRGVAALALRTGKQLISVMAVRGSDGGAGYRIDFAPIHIDAHETVDEVCQKIWNPLATAVAHDVTPWEAMRYADRFIEFNVDDNRVSRPGSAGVLNASLQRVGFNHFRFRLGGVADGRLFLFDRLTRKVREVSGSLASILRNVSAFEDGDQRWASVCASTLTELAELGLIMECPR